MRKLLLFALAPVAVIGAVPMLQASNYSVRDVGFVDIDVKPYRLVLVAKTLARADIKNRQADMRDELTRSNIRLQAKQVDAKSLTPDRKPVIDPDQFIKPQFWLIAPDDRVIPFDPAVSLRGLMRSPLRDRIQEEATQALCAVVLLQSTDEAANDKAKAKADRVVGQINEARTKLDKAPDRAIQLLILPVADRMKERWTLWGLGEEAEPSDMPKVAVIFGAMRRAGPLLEGAEWKEADLFARIAVLGQPFEGELDRKELLGPALPFAWSSDWHEQLTKSLEFNPKSQTIRTEMAALLQKPPVPPDQRVPRKVSFEDLMLGPVDAEKQPEVGKQNNAGADPWQPERNQGEAKGALAAPAAPPLIASAEVGIGLLVAGVAGWILLAAGVWFLERNAKPKT